MPYKKNDLSPQDRLIIHNECQRLTALYCHYIDHGEAARVAELFTDDAELSFPEGTLTGRAAIQQTMQARQDNTSLISRHVCSNFAMDIETCDMATGVVYLSWYRHQADPGSAENIIAPLNGPIGIGEYRDVFILTDNGWRIGRRQAVFSFLAPALMESSPA